MSVGASTGGEATAQVLILLFVVLWIVVPIFVGVQIANGRGRSPWAGFFLGFFLGWFGVVLCLFLPEGPGGYEPRYRSRGSRPRARRSTRRRRYR